MTGVDISNLLKDYKHLVGGSAEKKDAPKNTAQAKASKSPPPQRKPEKNAANPADPMKAGKPSPAVQYDDRHDFKPEKKQAGEHEAKPDKKPPLAQPNYYNANHVNWMVHLDKRFDRLNRRPMVDLAPDAIAHTTPVLPHHGMMSNPTVYPSLISNTQSVH